MCVIYLRCFAFEFFRSGSRDGRVGVILWEVINFFSCCVDWLFGEIFVFGVIVFLGCFSLRNF